MKRTFAVALFARLAVVVWAILAHVPPAADGTYYHVLASRLASGQGYTWAWPDGAVTYAAHYPVGYPALVAIAYAVFGAHPWLAMVLNAIVGALGAVAIHGLVAHAAPDRPRAATIAGLMVALHPALVPYTAALMTEGITASLLAIAAFLAARGRSIPAAFVMGVATLVRPQSLLLAPFLGFLPARARLADRVKHALLATAVTVLVCLPWTARNCVRMHRCALVSVNAGWNLLIGEETASGGWQEVDVPDECKTVWDEAAKDACFERAARAKILAAPLPWAARMPKKLDVTFDYFGAAPWYLHVAAPDAFGDYAKTILGAGETIAVRLLLLGALAAVAAREGPRRRARVVLAIAGGIAAFTVHGWLAYLALAAGAALIDGFVWRWTAATIALTAITHAVFFGAGRYGLVVVPFVSALAAIVLAGPMPPVAIASFKSSFKTS